MTLDTLLLMIVTIYLTLIAYGVAGVRRRMAGRPKLIAEVLLVAVPPLLLAGALVAADEAALVAAWWRLFALMAVSGAVIATLTEQIARRVGP